MVGINSYVSNYEGEDAGFGFAVSAREIIPFLREGGVKPHMTALPCRTSAEQAAIDERLDRSEAARAEAERNRAELSQERLQARRERLRDQILAERDGGLAIAGLLLVFGAVFLNGAMILLARDERRLALGAGAAGVLLMAGAPIAWVARPDLDQADARLAAQMPKTMTQTVETKGSMVCRADLERSRLTISEPQDASLSWSAPGCEGGHAPFADQDDRWVRAEVSPREAAASIRRFDPATSRYTVERYFLPADTLATARALQSKYQARNCTPEGARMAAGLTQALRDLLPSAPNERLVYACEHVQDGGTKG